jgi:hypothetical protein
MTSIIFMSRKRHARTVLILTFFLASCDSVATVSDPTAQLPPIEALETPTVAAIVQTDQSEDEGLEDIYQSAYQKAYEEGFTEGSTSCAQGFESDDAYPYEEYRGEDEYQMGYFNGFGEGFFDAYDVCDTMTKDQTVESEPRQLEEELEMPQQKTVEEVALLTSAEASGAGWNYRSAAENERALSPPDADAIRVDYDASSGQALLTAAARAVPAGATVVVANLELGDVALVRADAVGAFETQIASFPGTHIMIKQDSTGEVIQQDWDDMDIFQQDQIKSPGILLRVPQLKSQELVNGYAVAGGARITSDGPPWMFAGTLSETNLQSGDAFSVAGRITVLSDVASLEQATLSYSGQLLGDENGYQIGPAGEFLSNLLTPTGLPIERSSAKDPLAIFSQECNIQPLLLQ